MNMKLGMTQNLRACWRIKALLSLVVSLIFTAVYLLLQRYPNFPVTVMKTCWVDQITPFVPSAVLPYQSLWIMMPISLWFMATKNDLIRYNRAFLLICIVSFGVFFFFPTCVARPSAPQHSYAYAVLVWFDKSLNAFPSLHASLTTFSAVCCQRIFCQGRWRYAISCFIWVWASVILVSTLLTKQHVLADVLAGMGLGSIGYAFGFTSPLLRFSSGHGKSCDH